MPLPVDRKALVVGDDTRSFLATLRSLGRQGIEVHVAPYDHSAPALRSRYIVKVHAIPYYLGDGKVWLEAMRALLAAERFDLIIPCEERSLLPLMRHRAMFEPACRLAIPDEAGMAAFFDKFATRELAQACGVAVAPGRLLATNDSAQSLCAAFSLPLVLKYRKSYSWENLYVRKAAFVIHTLPELERWLETNPRAPGEVFVEGFFPGLGGGVSVLCDQGRVLQAFEHQRAHEVAGSSYYRRSVTLDQARLAAVAAMVDRVRYTGLAMFEYKLDTSSGAWCLLEVNARPWGSMPLPVALGVDFPYFLYRLLVDGVALPQAVYHPDIYGRNFIPDLWQLRSALAAQARHPLSALRHLGAWLGEFARVLTGREKQDLWVRDDPRPARAELYQFVRDRLQSLRLVCWISGMVGARRDWQRVSALAQSPLQKPSVMLLCQGNICRSPYAEMRLRELMPGTGQFDIDSAGLLPRNPRPSPGVALVAARARGIDLAPHQSRHAWRDTLEKASLIVIFDDVNLRHLAARHPDLCARAVYLGSLDPHGGAREIHDPDGKPEAVFAETYARIDRCLESLARLLGTTRA